MALTSVAAISQTANDLSLECLLEPSMTVNLGTPVPGVLASVLVGRGDIVRKGAPLARLDTRAELAAVELSRARAEFAKRRVARNEELYQDDLVSGQERDELITESLLADLELEERLVQLEIRTIRSPVDGIIVERIRSAGEYVQETEILTLAQINPLFVEVVVPVEYLGRIQRGMEATVALQSPVSSTHTAKVEVVDRVVDAASGTFGVRLHIPNKQLKIPAGLRCDVEFLFPE
jgi:RND family efflux transporter MFP subunit